MLSEDDRVRLVQAIRQGREHLAGLRLHEDRPAVTPTRAGLTFVGYRTWPAHRTLPHATVRRFRRRLRWMRRALAAGRIDHEAHRRRLAGWVGHAARANSRRLPDRLLG